MQAGLLAVLEEPPAAELEFPPAADVPPDQPGAAAFSELQPGTEAHTPAKRQQGTMLKLWTMRARVFMFKMSSSLKLTVKLAERQLRPIPNSQA